MVQAELSVQAPPRPENESNSTQIEPEMLQNFRKGATGGSSNGHQDALQPTAPSRVEPSAPPSDMGEELGTVPIQATQ